MVCATSKGTRSTVWAESLSWLCNLFPLSRLLVVNTFIMFSKFSSLQVGKVKGEFQVSGPNEIAMSGLVFRFTWLMMQTNIICWIVTIPKEIHTYSNRNNSYFQGEQVCSRTIVALCISGNASLRQVAIILHHHHHHFGLCHLTPSPANLQRTLLRFWHCIVGALEVKSVQEVSSYPPIHSQLLLRGHLAIPTLSLLVI